MKNKIVFIIAAFLILICFGYKIGKDAAERERRNKLVLFEKS